MTLTPTPDWIATLPSGGAYDMSLLDEKPWGCASEWCAWALGALLPGTDRPKLVAMLAEVAALTSSPIALERVEDARHASVIDIPITAMAVMWTLHHLTDDHGMPEAQAEAACGEILLRHFPTPPTRGAP